MMKNKHINAVWKCLPIYEQYGKDSYKIYLAKTIGRMRATTLSEIEKLVLNELESLYLMDDVLTHDILKSIILSCTNMLDNGEDK